MGSRYETYREAFTPVGSMGTLGNCRAVVSSVNYSQAEGTAHKTTTLMVATFSITRYCENSTWRNLPGRLHATDITSRFFTSYCFLEVNCTLSVVFTHTDRQHTRFQPLHLCRYMVYHQLTYLVEPSLAEPRPPSSGAGSKLKPRIGTVPSSQRCI